MRILPSALAITILLLGSTAGSTAQNLSATDKDQIVTEVIKHFREHPQELVEAILDWKQKEAASKTVVSATIPESGNPAGDVTIFEFPDYGCAPCRPTSKAVDDVAAADGKIRVLHHDYPVSSPDAVSAAIELIAANATGADWKKLRSIYLADGVAPETRLKAMAAAGTSPDLLKRSTVAAAQTITDNRKLAEKAGITELPAIVVSAGGKMQSLAGNKTAAEIAAAVEVVRKAAKGG